MSEPSEFANILTTLYSRKMNKANFNKIRKAFKEKTGQDLCKVVKVARSEIIADINAIPPGRLGRDLRTRMFKLTDYNTWMGYCKKRKR